MPVPASRPDLWSAAIMAINDTSGQWVWGFQANVTRLGLRLLLWQAMGNETVSGVNTQVVWKTCKAGYLFELNAATGAMIWSWTPPTSILARCHFCYLLDPLNRTEMSFPFLNPSLQPHSVPMHLPFESEGAFNPATNYI